MGREMILRAAVVLALLGCLGGCSCNDPAPLADAGERRDGTPADARVDAAVADVGGDVADLAVDGPGDVGVDRGIDRAVADLGPDSVERDGLLMHHDLGSLDAGPPRSTWAFNWGGKDYDAIVDVSVDGQGNAYLLALTGVFGSWPYYYHNALYSLVIKVDPWGRILWTRALYRANNTLTAQGIATDRAGNSYVVYFTGQYNNRVDFLEKIHPSGKGLWTKMLGNGEIQLYDKTVAVDAHGNTIIAGALKQSATLGSIQLPMSKGGYFIAKASPSGKWQWVAQGGTGPAGLSLNGGVAVDTVGNAYIAGILSAHLATKSFGIHTVTCQGGRDAFAAKLSAGGKRWIWAVNGGGSGLDEALGIAADDQGNAYISGVFSSNTVTFGNSTLNHAGNDDGFVAKIDPQGRFSWGIACAGAKYDTGTGIEVGPKGNIYATGWVTGNAHIGTVAVTSGVTNTYLAKMTPAGAVTWVKHGTSTQGLALGLTSVSAYVVGQMMGFAQFGSSTANSNGSYDGLVWKTANTP